MMRTIEWSFCRSQRAHIILWIAGIYLTSLFATCFVYESFNQKYAAIHLKNYDMHTKTSIKRVCFQRSFECSPLMRSSNFHDSDVSIDPSNEENITSLSDSQFDPTAASPEPLPMVMEGGPAQIFAMARRMLTWEGAYMNDSSEFGNNQDALQTSSQTKEMTRKIRPLPRWRPHAGVSDYNPSFRDRSPAMNSMGYANAIRRNSRKRNKPSMWKYALRTYNRMNATSVKYTDNRNEIISNPSPKSLKIPQRNVHHEAALVACSKLGDWREAFKIFRAVEYQQCMQELEEGTTSKSREKNYCFITDNMIHSLIKACVRASRLKYDPQTKARITLEQRREPLDKIISDVICILPTKFNLPVLSSHINPIASAYNNLSMFEEASIVIQTYLTNRKNRTKKKIMKSASISEEQKYYEENLEFNQNNFDDDYDQYYEEDPTERKRFNVLNIGTKDRGSYSLLVQGAAQKGDWETAVKRLEEMTAAGIYPEARCLNLWTEGAGKKDDGWHYN